jgi:hypothetical protein
MDVAVTVDSLASVLRHSRQQYHRLAKVLHPDKCSHAGAESAFATLGRAMRVISEHSNDHSDAAPASATPAPGGGGDAAAPGDECAAPGVLGHLHSGEGLLEQIVWTPQRLVLQAVVLPPPLHAQLPRGVGYAEAAAAAGGDEPLLFLPLSLIPTFQRPHPGSTARGPGAAQAASAGDPQIQQVLAQLVEGVAAQALADEEATLAQAGPAAASPPESDYCPQPQGADDAAPGGRAPGEAGLSGGELQEEEGDAVEGVLLVTCRAALRGRFPLNGTYFQINEVFADNETVQRPVKVRLVPPPPRVCSSMQRAMLGVSLCCALQPHGSNVRSLCCVLQLPRSLLEGCKSCAVHFGLGIHFMCALCNCK